MERHQSTPRHAYVFEYSTCASGNVQSRSSERVISKQRHSNGEPVWTRASRRPNLVGSTTMLEKEWCWAVSLGLCPTRLYGAHSSPFSSPRGVAAGVASSSPQWSRQWRPTITQTCCSTRCDPWGPLSARTGHRQGLAQKRSSDSRYGRESIGFRPLHVTPGASVKTRHGRMQTNRMRLSCCLPNPAEPHPGVQNRSRKPSILNDWSDLPLSVLVLTRHAMTH